MKLSEITVEDLRADHDAFIAKMKEVREKHPPLPDHELMNGCIVPASELAQIEHDPNWREKLRNKSPFDN
jgi:hypothetical protein